MRTPAIHSARPRTAGHRRTGALAVVGACLLAGLTACSSPPSGGADGSAGPGASGTPGASASGAPVVAGTPVTVPGTERRALRSASTGTSYDLYISYPDSYRTAPDAKYPVLYLLDAQWDFALSRAIHGNQVYDGRIPEMILVGITYTGENPDYGRLRNHDLIPVEEPRASGSGGAPEFLRFVKTELIPYVETNLRGDPGRRVLQGSSFAGLFTLYALFTDPTLFYGYIAGSPAVWPGSEALGRQEAEYFAKRQDLPARLWIAVGGSEDLAGPVNRFVDVLGKRGYTGLAFRSAVLEGEGHAGSKAEVFNRGIRHIFQS